jgi:hypothetical protein
MGNIGSWECHKKTRVLAWEIARFQILNKPIAHQAMQNVGNETQYGVGGEAIVDLVTIGDNMAVPCESNNGKTFGLLLCDKPKHVVKHTFKDSYGNTYYEGDEVI